jgi:hypothetical protein
MGIRNQRQLIVVAAVAAGVWLAATTLPRIGPESELPMAQPTYHDVAESAEVPMSGQPLPTTRLERGCVERAGAGGSTAGLVSVTRTRSASAMVATRFQARYAPVARRQRPGNPTPAPSTIDVGAAMPGDAGASGTFPHQPDELSSAERGSARSGLDGRHASGPIVASGTVRSVDPIPVESRLVVRDPQTPVGMIIDPGDYHGRTVVLTLPERRDGDCFLTLHGDAAAGCLIDGSPAVPGHEYLVHDGLTVTAPAPVGVHLRPAQPRGIG